MTTAKKTTKKKSGVIGVVVTTVISTGLAVFGWEKLAKAMGI